MRTDHPAGVQMCGCGEPHPLGRPCPNDHRPTGPRTQRIEAAADLLGYARQAEETDGPDEKVDTARLALQRLGVTEYELAVAEQILAGGVG